MAIHIQSVSIKHFRGLKNMKAGNLNHVNLLVGNNNCGKTSVLEALQLLRAPTDFYNVLRISKLRETYGGINRSSAFEAFSNLFPQPSDRPELYVEAGTERGKTYCGLKGQWEKALLDEVDFRRAYQISSSMRQSSVPPELPAFFGEISGGVGAHEKTENVLFHEFSRGVNVSNRAREEWNMVYLSPVDHVKNGIMSRIIANEEYKQVCLRILKLFDPDIEDLLILKNEMTNRPVEYIRHRRTGTMPVSTYGDGIRRVLLLTNAIAKVRGGILLIDEIETAIHAQYYEDIFEFVLAACLQFDVQLFVSTHNQEALDALLAVQRYEADRNDNECVSVLTLKKTGECTLTRNMTGREVLNDREAFDFEVRL